MTDQKKPEELKDDDLDQVQGGNYEKIEWTVRKESGEFRDARKGTDWKVEEGEKGIVVQAGDGSI